MTTSATVADKCQFATGMMCRYEQLGARDTGSRFLFTIEQNRGRADCRETLQLAVSLCFPKLSACLRAGKKVRVLHSSEAQKPPPKTLACQDRACPATRDSLSPTGKSEPAVSHPWAGQQPVRQSAGTLGASGHAACRSSEVEQERRWRSFCGMPSWNAGGLGSCAPALGCSGQELRQSPIADNNWDWQAKGTAVRPSIDVHRDQARLPETTGPETGSQAASVGATKPMAWRTCRMWNTPSPRGRKEYTPGRMRVLWTT